MKEVITLFYLIRSDLRRYFDTSRRRGVPPRKAKIVFETFIFKAGFHAVFLYRLSHFFYRLHLLYLAWFLSRMNVALTGAEIEFNAQIGEGFFISHPVGIVIGRGTVIGKNLTLFQGVTFGVKDWSPEGIKAFPVVGDNVMVFAGAKVLGKVHIGSNSYIGANAVVSQDVESGVMVAGIPARVVKESTPP